MNFLECFEMTVDNGEKYRRTITQTLPDEDGGTEEIAITIDVYDILAVFDVSCPARSKG